MKTDLPTKRKEQKKNYKIKLIEFQEKKKSSFFS